MKKRILNIFIVLSILILNIIPAQAVESLNVGLILDGQNLEYVKPMLEKELKDLLRHKAQVGISDKNVVIANWSKEKVLKGYELLSKSEDVDIIVGIGILASEVVSAQKDFLKPTICYGAQNSDVDPKIKNLAYLSVMPNRKEHLEKLTKIYPYKNIAVVSMLNKTVGKKDGFVYTDLAGLSSVLSSDETIDAIYLGYLGDGEGDTKKQLIKDLTAQGYPVFGFSKEDLKNGAYAVYTADSNLIVSVKNIAMIIDGYLDGMPISDYEPLNDITGYVAVNLETAKTIQKVPSYKVLREVVVYNENLNSKVRPVDIRQVILYALENNLDLSSNKIQSQIAKREVLLSKRNFFPSISVGPNFFFVDKQYSNLINERTGMFNVSLNQLIYSNRAVSGILSSKDLFKAQEYKQAQEALDAVKKASQAYLNILKSQNRQNVFQNLLEFSRKNLELKEKAQKFGEIPMSDVYRWKTEYSMNKNNFIAAQNSTEQARLALNNILNQPINSILVPVDINLGSEMFMSFENQSIKKVVDDPLASERFADFLTQKALAENPLLKASESQIEASEKIAKYYKTKNLLPEVQLRSTLINGMYNEGKGPSNASTSSSYVSSVVASWDVFDGDKSRINLQKTKLEIDRLTKQKDNLRNNIEYGIRAGVLELVSKSANIDLSAKSADYAKKNLDLMQKSYDLGKVSIIELLNAKNAESKAKMQYLDSVYDYLISVIDLQSQVGSYNVLSTEESQKELYKDFQEYLVKKESL